MQNDNPACLTAKRHAERRIGFLVHFGMNTAVNAVLILPKLALLARMPFALGPLPGWGIRLLFHALGIFLRAPGAGWKQRMIDNELGKLQAKPPE